MEIKHRYNVVRYITLMAQLEHLNEADDTKARDMMAAHWDILTNDEKAFCNDIARIIVEP